MEDFSNKKVESYDFLKKESVEQNFASINIALLKGRHIQQDEFKLFQVIDHEIKHFKFYYKQLYQLNLKKGISNQVQYFYLDFPDENKGKLYQIDRHKYLSELQTVITLLLLNMYYSEYFSFAKEITWDDIRKEIDSGENSLLYQKIFFKKVKQGGYSDKEWSRAKTLIENTIKSIEKMGWVERVKNSQGNSIQFIIRESINRFAEMYQDELTHFENFAEKISQNRINGQL